MSRTPNGLAPSRKLPTGAVVGHPSSSSYSALRGVPSRLAAARHSAPHALSRRALGAALPQGWMRPSLPRAAYSHSASVGSRPPLQAQYAAACPQSTQLIGWLGRSLPLHARLNSFSSLPEYDDQFTVIGGALHARAAAHAAYAATVTSVRSMQ